MYWSVFNDSLALSHSLEFKTDQPIMEKSTCQTRGLIVYAVFAFNGQLQGKKKKKKRLEV